MRYLAELTAAHNPNCIFTSAHQRPPCTHTDPASVTGIEVWEWGGGDAGGLSSWKAAFPESVCTRWCKSCEHFSKRCRRWTDQRGRHMCKHTHTHTSWHNHGTILWPYVPLRYHPSPSMHCTNCVCVCVWWGADASHGPIWLSFPASWNCMMESSKATES